MEKSCILRLLLFMAYIMIPIFSFLAGMFSESLIGSTHPWAGTLANVIVWFGVVVAFSPVACMVAASALQKKPAARRIVLALPFILLAVQLLLGHIADML